MGGGLMQLVAVGAQDIMLTGSPSITFWRAIYRRYTSFACESIEQTFSGTVGFGRKVSCTVSRNGDLISTAYLEIVLKKKAPGASYYPAEQLISEISLEIGGQQIDKIYSDYYRIYDELFRTSSEKDAYARMTNFESADQDGTVKRFYLPLIFFFNRSPGSALPLISLQYHEVKINVTFATATEVATNGVDDTYTPSVSLWVTYVFLDSDERRRFASASHEYLITQTQSQGAESIAPDTSTRKTNNIRLNFNHPTKFIAWAAKVPGKHGRFNGSDSPLTTDDAYGPLYSAKLTLNGHDRFSERKGSWFNQVQAYETFQSRPAAGIYLYSFSLRPNDTQPSGTCNFSRIDNATLVLTWKAGTGAGANITAQRSNVTSIDENTVANVAALTNLVIFAENYNVLRVLSGMAGLAFSN